MKWKILIDTGESNSHRNVYPNFDLKLKIYLVLPERCHSSYCTFKSILRVSSFHMGSEKKYFYILGKLFYFSTCSVNIHSVYSVSLAYLRSFT